MAIPNSSYDELASTTLDKYSAKLADNILTHNPLLERLKSKGNTKNFSGGKKILENLMYAENDTVAWYSGLEVLNVSQSDVFTSADFDIKELNANVVISGLEQAQNSGSKESVHNLLTSRIRVAEKTMANEMARAIFYGNTENGGKSLGGLQHLVSGTPATGTVGGIDASANAFWRNQEYDFSDESATASKATIRTAMNKVYLNTLRGTDMVDMFIGDVNYFEFYLDSLQENQRFMDDGQAGSGFKSLKFWGGAADVFYDANCPTNTMYALNTGYIHWRPHSSFNFKTGKSRQSVNQDGTVIPMFWKGNMTVSNRSLQGIIEA